MHRVAAYMRRATGPVSAEELRSSRDRWFRGVRSLRMRPTGMCCLTRFRCLTQMWCLTRTAVGTPATLLASESPAGPVGLGACSDDAPCAGQVETEAAL